MVHCFSTYYIHFGASQLLLSSPHGANSFSHGPRGYRGSSVLSCYDMGDSYLIIILKKLLWADGDYNIISSCL